MEDGCPRGAISKFLEPDCTVCDSPPTWIRADDGGILGSRRLRVNARVLDRELRHAESFPRHPANPRFVCLLTDTCNISPQQHLRAQVSHLQFMTHKVSDRCCNTVR